MIKPEDWEAFCEWYRQNYPFKPRSWDYFKSPTWLKRDYRKLNGLRLRQVSNK